MKYFFLLLSPGFYMKLCNEDGIEPDSREDVLIGHCCIDTHDDTIAIEVGRDQGARLRPGACSRAEFTGILIKE